MIPHTCECGVPIISRLLILSIYSPERQECVILPKAYRGTASVRLGQKVRFCPRRTEAQVRGGPIQVCLNAPFEAENSTSPNRGDFFPWRHIRDLLQKDYIIDPHVLVLVKTYRVSNVTVMGQVGAPGLIDLPAERRLDILSGIAQAGGFTKLARTSKIDLTRAGVTQTYDLEKLKRETNPAKKIWLSPDDLIYVHESAF